MKRSAFGALCATALAASTIAAAAVAGAAPSGSRSVQDTVRSLEANGYRVILNRVGGAPLEDCAVTAVRPGREVTETRRNARDKRVEHVLYTTVYVDAAC